MQSVLKSLLQPFAVLEHLSGSLQLVQRPLGLYASSSFDADFLCEAVGLHAVEEQHFAWSSLPL